MKILTFQHFSFYEQLMFHAQLSLAWKSMGESFQDYSWIQDFDADFPLKVSLKMLK